MRYTNILVRLSVKKAAIFAAIKGLPGWNVPANGAPHPLEITDSSRQSGRSSGVEHNLAKVGVEGSNPFARSSFPSHRQVADHCRQATR
jgi:hypothetical protein